MLSLSDFDTVEEAKAYEYTTSRMLSPDIVVAYLSEFNSVISLQSLAVTNDVAAGFLLALSGTVKEYNIVTGDDLGNKQQMSLSYLQSMGAVTSEFVDAVIYYANNKIETPYAGVTQTQFNIANDIYTEVEVTGYSGEDIKITLDSDIDCTVTTWDLTEFGYENFGKVGHVKAINEITRLATNNKKANGVLYVRAPIESAAMTVELI